MANTFSKTYWRFEYLLLLSNGMLLTTKQLIGSVNKENLIIMLCPCSLYDLVEQALAEEACASALLPKVPSLMPTTSDKIYVQF